MAGAPICSGHVVQAAAVFVILLCNRKLCHTNARLPAGARMVMFLSIMKSSARVVAILSIAIAMTGAHRVGSVRAAEPPMAEAWNGAEIAWRDVRRGIYEASQSGKIAIMVFHAPWCASCKKYRHVFKDPGVVAASKNFVMILIDADADKMSNGAFSPDGTYVPRTIFYNSDGDVLTAYVGKDAKFPHTIDIESPDELRGLMQQASTSGDVKRPVPISNPN